jgi:hypothetical protein
MLKHLIICCGLLLNLPTASEADSFCKDWPIFKLTDGTRACAATFGPLNGEDFTAATGQFHLLSEVDQNEGINRKRGLVLCRAFRDKIVGQSRELWLKNPDYIAIIQTWKIGEQSDVVDKVQNYTVLTDKRCREVRS